MWNAVAEYEDGTRIERNFPYNEGGNYIAECETGKNWGPRSGRSGN